MFMSANSGLEYSLEKSQVFAWKMQAVLLESSQGRAMLYYVLILLPYLVSSKPRLITFIYLLISLRIIIIFTYYITAILQLLYVALSYC